MREWNTKLSKQLHIGNTGDQAQNLHNMKNKMILGIVVIIAIIRAAREKTGGLSRDGADSNVSAMEKTLPEIITGQRYQTNQLHSH